MNLRIFVLLLFVLIFGKSKANIFEDIESKKIAVGLGKAIFFSDTSWSKQTNIVFEEGELFEILAASKTEHDDKDQAQKFRWYKVQSKNKQTGWVFGDALALIETDKLPAHLSSFHKKKWQFDNGFEKTMSWIATINGTESEQNFMSNPFYNETYLVFTNERGNSVLVNLAGQSVGGETKLKSVDIQDVTADNVPDVIVEKKNFATGSPLENRDVEVYAFQSGTLRKIFEERLTLTDGDDTPSPTLFKKIDIAQKNIRVAYVDFLRCENYSQDLPFDLRSATQERCLEYVTTTYSWDEAKKQFVTLYTESRTPMIVFAKQSYDLYAEPNEKNKLDKKATLDEELVWVKIYENFKAEGDSTVPDHWLYIKNKNGDFGYIQAYKVYFGELEHADVLHEYLNYAPASRLDWKIEEEFLTINKKDENE